MTGVCICNNRSQEIGVCNVATVRLWCSDPFFPLLAVMEKLSQEELLNFVWNGILHFISTMNVLFDSMSDHWIICQIRRGFVCGRRS